jgi:hypothetical protein
VSTDAFELTVSISPDERLTPAVRDLVRCAAQAVGCDQQATDTFCRQVEDAMRHTMLAGSTRRMLPVTLRSSGRTVEVVVGGRVLTLDGHRQDR